MLQQTDALPVGSIAAVVSAQLGVRVSPSSSLPWRWQPMLSSRPKWTSDSSEEEDDEDASKSDKALKANLLSAWNEIASHKYGLPRAGIHRPTALTHRSSETHRSSARRLPTRSPTTPTSCSAPWTSILSSAMSTQAFVGRLAYFIADRLLTGDRVYKGL